MSDADTKDKEKKGFWQEFKEFAARGSVMDMAVGIAVGAAFANIAKSLVEDIIMPPLSLVIGGDQWSRMFVVIDDPSGGGPYPSSEVATEAGATLIEYGAFIETIISFLVVAFAIFMVIRAMNRLKRLREAEVEPTPASPRDKECRFCAMTIPRKATRCPECTSHLEEAPTAS